MIKIVFCLKRHPRLTRAEFQKYWRESHASLVKENIGVLSIRRYVQSHSISDPKLTGLANARGSVGQEFDGVAEIWFDSPEVLHDTNTPPEAAIAAGRALLNDEAQFIDLANSPIFVVEEHEIVGFCHEHGTY